MGAVVEDAVARGAEQPQGQLCEYQGTELQTLLLSHVGTQPRPRGAQPMLGGFEGATHPGVLL